APGELAAELAGRDRVVGNPRRRHPGRLDTGVAPDPREAHTVAQATAERLGEGEARRGVASGPAAGEDDRQRRRRWGRPVGRTGRARLWHPAWIRRALGIRAAASLRGARGPAR